MVIPVKEVRAVDITVGGQEAAVKWKICLKTKTGNVFFLEGIGIIKVNENGKFNRTEISLISRIFSRN